MSVARTWVFPILRIVVFAAIAAALVKLAFFPDATNPDTPEFPTGQIVEPQVPVTVGTVANDIVLDGTVNADAAASAQATINGEVRKVSVTQGQWVDAGAEIMQIRGQNEDGTNKWAVIKAPISGVLVEFDTLVGQSTSIGEVVARVAPSTFNVTAAIAPADRYRLLDLPTEAQVAIVGGPAPFTCTGLTIAAATSSGDDGPDGGSGGEASTSVVARCAVPSDVRVFPGLTATMTISGGLAENVLIVPTTAVEGGSGTGVVYVVAEDGSTEPREVTLGLTDGINVEVLTGLEEGEIVLQFVPGAPAGPGMGDPAMDCGNLPAMYGPSGEFLGCGG